MATPSKTPKKAATNSGTTSGGNTQRTIRDVAPAFGLGTLGLSSKGLTSLYGLGCNTDLKVLYLQGNNLRTFEHLVSQPQLRELNVSDNKLSSFKGIAFQPKLEVLTIRGNPISSHPFYRIMAILAIGPSLRKIDDTTILHSERDLARSMGPRAAAAVRLGWLMDSKPRLPQDYELLLDQFEKGDVCPESRGKTDSPQRDREEEEALYIQEQVFLKEAEVTRILAASNGSATPNGRPSSHGENGTADANGHRSEHVDVEEERRAKERLLVRGLQKEVATLRQKHLSSKNLFANSTPPRVIAPAQQKSPSAAANGGSVDTAAPVAVASNSPCSCSCPSCSSSSSTTTSATREHPFVSILPNVAEVLFSAGIKVTKESVSWTSCVVFLHFLVEAFYVEDESVLRLVTKSGKALDVAVPQSEVADVEAVIMGFQKLRKTLTGLSIPDQEFVEITKQEAPADAPPITSEATPDSQQPTTPEQPPATSEQDPDLSDQPVAAAQEQPTSSPPTEAPSTSAAPSSETQPTSDAPAAADPSNPNTGADSPTPISQSTDLQPNAPSDAVASHDQQQCQPMPVPKKADSPPEDSAPSNVDASSSESQETTSDAVSTAAATAPSS
eukprot:ANDGO_00981.mRNA.1 187-kDa microtubule-associated protein AIR9